MSFSIDKINPFNSVQGVNQGFSPAASAAISGGSTSGSNMFSGSTSGLSNLGTGDTMFTAAQSGVPAGIAGRKFHAIG